MIVSPGGTNTAHHKKAPIKPVHTCHMIKSWTWRYYGKLVKKQLHFNSTCLPPETKFCRRQPKLFLK